MISIRWLSLLGVGVALSLLLALCLGSVTVTPADLWTALWFPDAPGHDAMAQSIVMQLRLPRALTAFALGGMLALSGMLMQVLLRNPLADPYVLGTSGGAAVAALSAMLLGAGAAWVQGAAALGAFISILIVFALAHLEGSWSPTRLLLSGVVFASGMAAIISLLLATGDEAQLRGMLFWLMGDLSGAHHTTGLWLLWLIVGAISVVWSRHFNVLARGEVSASALGMDVPRLRIALFVLTALLTAAAVTQAGSIGFVGMLVPHLARRMVGADHRRLTPVVMALGGCLLVLADTAARTVLAPRQLPVGALTAVLGVPLFLLLMFKRR